MKKFVYAEDSLKHIECSIIAFNGMCPIKHFDDDNSFLMAWKSRQIQKKKFITVSAFDKLEKDFLNKITKKLRVNSSLRPDENKAYAFFMRNYGFSREELNKKLGI